MRIDGLGTIKDGLRPYYIRLPYPTFAWHEHFYRKHKVIPGFTTQYNVHMLGYYETHSTYIEAARRERRRTDACAKSQE